MTVPMSLLTPKCRSWTGVSTSGEWVKMSLEPNTTFAGVLGLGFLFVGLAPGARAGRASPGQPPAPVLRVLFVALGIFLLAKCLEDMGASR